VPIPRALLVHAEYLASLSRRTFGDEDVADLLSGADFCVPAACNAYSSTGEAFGNSIAVILKAARTHSGFTP